MPLNEKDVLAAIAELVDPVTDRNFVESKSVKNVKIEGDRVSLDVVLGYPARGVIESVRRTVSERVKAIPASPRRASTCTRRSSRTPCSAA
jgi:ATP-binding protein involved in chromosome partitioning